MEPYIGQIAAFGFNFAPKGWLKCEGQILPISNYTALFSLLGTAYGGDGRLTFALPDLRGRMLIGTGIGPGLSPIEHGEKKGNEKTALKIENMPPHTHEATLNVSDKNASMEIAVSNATIATAGTGDSRNFSTIKGFNTDIPEVSLNQKSVVINTSGKGKSFDNRSPYLGINYCIAIEGLYPPRS